MTRGALHEDMTRRGAVRGSPARSFGLVVAAAFLVIALLPSWKGGDIRWWSLGLGAAFLLAAAIRPAILAPLNRLWFKLGMLLGRVTYPVVMGIIFFLVVTPAAFVLRLRAMTRGDFQKPVFPCLANDLSDTQNRARLVSGGNGGGIAEGTPERLENAARRGSCCLV